MKTYNEVYSAPSMKRRYEVWFLRLGLSDGSGAWWFRYLLLNPGRGGCAHGDHEEKGPTAGIGAGSGNVDGNSKTHGSDAGAQRQPVQVWATWFPRAGKPETWIQGFSLRDFRLSERGASPFFFAVGENRGGENRSSDNQSSENRIGESECRGNIEVNGHCIGWSLRYRSTFRTELSSKGWIGFSRTPHSDAIFSGEITLDGRTFRGEPLGYGLQGHNCGYRHRGTWTWTHLHFPAADAQSSTFEALCYDMPLGLMFRRAVLWHKGKKYTFGKLREGLRDSRRLAWKLQAEDGSGARIEAEIAGRDGYVHRLPYRKTDCSGVFEVANDSLAVARVILKLPDRPAEELTTDSGAVLEMAGN